MRLSYEPPEITQLGSVTELTQADVFASGTDYIFGIPLLGDKDEMFS